MVPLVLTHGHVVEGVSFFGVGLAPYRHVALFNSSSLSSESLSH